MLLERVRVGRSDLEPGASVYEVELKFSLLGSTIEPRLVALSARFREAIDQVDRYFSHPCRDFSKTDEALRLRKVGGHVAITWKGPRIDTATKTRREIELDLLPSPSTTSGAGGSGAVTIQQWTELLESP